MKDMIIRFISFAFVTLFVINVTGCVLSNGTNESAGKTPPEMPVEISDDTRDEQEDAASQGSTEIQPMDESAEEPTIGSAEEPAPDPAVLPEIPETAQETYRAVMQKTLPYDCLLKDNEPVNQNIAQKTAEVLEACRQGKDPNNLLPASDTSYEPYPPETVRDDPDAEEIGAILRKAAVDEDGTICFGIDLGGGWFMSLPIRIGGFGDSWQAYFTGVSYHETAQDYRMWLDGEITADELMSRPGVMNDFIKSIRAVTGCDLSYENFTWKYVEEEDRYPFRFTATDEDGNKAKGFEAAVISYRDDTGEDTKYCVEAAPYIYDPETLTIIEYH